MTTTHSASEIIATLLVQEGKAAFEEGDVEHNAWKWRVFNNIMPDEPYKLLVVYNTQGISNGRSQETGEQFEHYGFQIMARAEDGPSAFNALRLLRDYFETVLRAEVVIEQQDLDGALVPPGTYRVNQVSRTSPILYAGQDTDKRRFMYTLNCITSITQIA